MSTTNKAFIKAYRQDVAEPASAVRGSHDSQPSPTDSFQTLVAATSSVRGNARSGDVRRAFGDQYTTLAEPQATLPGSTERRPLSSYRPRAASTEPAQTQVSPTAPHAHRNAGLPTVSTDQGERADGAAFCPGTTVASFQWPAVCRTLLQQSGTQLDPVVRLLESRARAGNSLIGVLGMFSQVGATTTALCLGARAAGRGRRVIVADGNLVRPGLAQVLDAVPTAGWEEFLKHSAPLADAAIHATADNLDVLALGPRPAKDPQTLASGLQAAVTAGVLRHAYDLVLLDLGTFFDPATQPTVLELAGNMGVDGVIAVTGPEPADPRDLATIVEHLGRSGCELLGVIENRVAKPKAA